MQRDVQSQRQLTISLYCIFSQMSHNAASDNRCVSKKRTEGTYQRESEGADKQVTNPPMPQHARAPPSMYGNASSPAVGSQQAGQINEACSTMNQDARMSKEQSSLPITLHPFWSGLRTIRSAMSSTMQHTKLHSMTRPKTKKGSALYKALAELDSDMPVITPQQRDIVQTKERLNYQESQRHLAVAGVSGSGKSSLVNALRMCFGGFNQLSKAKTGIVETTQEITRYEVPHISYPFVLYDIPGSGTLDKPGWIYFHEQGLYIFDAIIVLIDNRFTQYDIAILKNCAHLNIPTFIVRSKSCSHVRNIVSELQGSFGNMPLVIDKQDPASETFFQQARDEYMDKTRASVQANLEQARLPNQRVYFVDKSNFLKTQPDKLLRFDEDELVGELLKTISLLHISTEKTHGVNGSTSESLRPAHTDQEMGDHPELRNTPPIGISDTIAGSDGNNSTKDHELTTPGSTLFESADKIPADPNVQSGGPQTRIEDPIHPTSTSQEKNCEANVDTSEHSSPQSAHTKPGPEDTPASGNIHPAENSDTVANSAGCELTAPVLISLETADGLPVDSNVQSGDPQTRTESPSHSILTSSEETCGAKANTSLVNSDTSLVDSNTSSVKADTSEVKADTSEHSFLLSAHTGRELEAPSAPENAHLSDGLDTVAGAGENSSPKDYEPTKGGSASPEATDVPEADSKMQADDPENDMPGGFGSHFSPGLA